MDCCDDYYESTSPLLIRLNRFPKRMSYLADDKKLFNGMVDYDMDKSLSVVCNSSESIVNFVHNYSDYLLISCKDNRTFSFCQKYYLFKVSHDLKCKRFSRMSCTVSLISTQSRCPKALHQYHVDLYSDVVSFEQLIL